MDESNVRCFFDIEVDSVPLGRIIFALFTEICPKTCENFRALCTGEGGIGKTTQKPLHYKNVKFHRVIKDFMIQAGDFSAGNGTGGESIYGGQFEDENFEVKHDSPFLLSMANRGKDTNGSQFFITTQTASHLDGKHVVFGHVVSGQEVVVAIENLPVDNHSRPLQQAFVTNCGELILQRSGKTKTKEKKKKKKKAEAEGPESDAEKKKKKKKEKKHKHKKEKLSEGEIEDDDEVDDAPGVNEKDATAGSNHYRPHPLASVSVINPDEIPEVPKNRFLDRGFQNRRNDEAGDDQQLPAGRLKSKANVQFYTRSGRKVKGRGSLRYRTPSRSRSRSVTPPHWRQAQRRTVSLEKYQRQAELQHEREKELEERRRRREERHKIMYGGADRSELIEEEHESGTRMRNRNLNQYVAGEDDKTSRDWRVARLETSLEDKENSSRVDRQQLMKRDMQDLRQKLKEKMENRSFMDQNEKKNNKPKDDDHLDMDDTALDYEAPSDNEEEDSTTGNQSHEVMADQEGPKRQADSKKQDTRERERMRHATKSSEKGSRDSRRKRSRSRDAHSRGSHNLVDREKDRSSARGRKHSRSREKESRKGSGRSRDRRDKSRSRERRSNRDRSDGRRKTEKSSEKRSKRPKSSSSGSSSGAE